MSEEKTVSKPKQLWSSALKAVKGDSTQQLVEDFTAEMTLVAEGLCEDQSRLRQSVEDVRREQDRSAQHVDSELHALECAIQEGQRETERRLDELSRCLSALENKTPQKRTKQAGIMQQATVLVAMVCITVLIVAVLKLFQ